LPAIFPQPSYIVEVEKTSQETIDEEKTNAANPWLERTGWAKYLKKLDRPKLLESIREPNVRNGPHASGHK
jgi:hypothetical protein